MKSRTEDESTTTVRKMLAAELQVEEAFLKEDFRWLELLGPEDAGIFLSELNEVFTRIPNGFSFGAGDQLFHTFGDANLLEEIATVGGLTLHVERHVAKAKSVNKIP